MSTKSVLKITVDTIDVAKTKKALRNSGFIVDGTTDHSVSFLVTPEIITEARKWLESHGYYVENYPELDANPDNDEFECENCNGIFDIDDSVRVEKGVLFCEDCAEQLRRDEKNGLYPDKEDMAN
jgi:hypothetical protein